MPKTVTPLTALALLLTKAQYDKSTDTYVVRISGDLYRIMTNTPKEL